MRLLKALQSRWRNIFFRLSGVKIDGYCWLQAIEIPKNHRSIQLGKNCSLDRGVTLLSNQSIPVGGAPIIKIGAGTYINRNSFIYANESVHIGENCAIGPNCYITDHDHTMVSGKTPLESPLNSKPIRIENEVWIGANVIILKGVTVGRRSVVGAGSVVTKSVAEKVIVAGNPAKIIRGLNEI